MPSKDFKKIIIDKLSDILKPKKFKRSGNTYSLSNGDLTYFINVQSSMSSTAATLKLTLNIEIYSSLIYKLEDTSIPEKRSRHFTRRIGSFLENPDDKWWAIESDNQANDAADEIAEIILTYVLPTFEKLTTTTDLATLWRQNKCPGLTDYQRKEYLSLLDMVK